MAFFDDGLLLGGNTARALYAKVKDLPIIDYHCHLDPKAIADDEPLTDIGAIWLKGDHYKWRAMRLCGVDEYYITGNAPYKERFVKYAGCLPMLLGNPLYYWTHMELKQIFGIAAPLNGDNAAEIYDAANGMLRGLTAGGLLERFGVKYVATTDDPCDGLEYHGVHGGVRVAPTFRPDKAFRCGKAYLKALAAASGRGIGTLPELKRALSDRLDYFADHGCGISDHGFGGFAPLISEREAGEIFCKSSVNKQESDGLYMHLLRFMAAEYCKRGITMQLHFSVMRNVNSEMLGSVGADGGFDVFGNAADAESVSLFLDGLSMSGALPKTVLYSLNPGATPMLAAMSGAFKNVRIGAAWWFNDTVNGIREHLKAVSEYAVIGNNLGMLTDSRSFTSYVRFDFFRRILADLVADKIDAGEYDPKSAAQLTADICFNNSKEFFRL
ncbi:MAG: glucuronate isomerase [Clostridiales bacterium]|jgi:glucuronate isomerase|nr:glucuronate isomerase [Clostridiales bacterium]